MGYEDQHRARGVSCGAVLDDRQISRLRIVANTVVPGLLDRYLGKTGFKSQQTEEPEDPNRPDNLWEPVAGDRGAHGRFDDRSHGRSLQWWATTHRGWLALAGAGVTSAALVWRSRRNGLA